RQPAGFGEVGDAGKATALLVDRSADFDGSRQPNARAPDRLCRKHRRGNACFHIARTAAEDLPVARGAGKRSHRPAAARRHDVEVPVQVHDRARSASSGADDVDARMPGRVLGPPSGGDVLDGEAAPRETLADEARAGGVLVAWRIDRRNPNEIGRVLHDLIGCAIDLFDDAIRLGHCDYDTAECGAGKNDRKARQGPAFAHVPSVSFGPASAKEPRSAQKPSRALPSLRSTSVLCLLRVLCGRSSGFAGFAVDPLAWPSYSYRSAS